MDISSVQLIKQIKYINKLANTNVKFKFSDKFNDDLNITLKHLAAFQDAVKNSQMDVFEAESSYLQNIPRDAKAYALGNDTSNPNFLNAYAAQQRKIEIENMAQTKSWENISRLISLYNTGLKDTGITQEDFLNLVSSGNGTLGKYLSTTKQGEATLKGFAKAAVTAKAAMIGMELATAALNAGLSLLVTLGVQAFIKLVDELHQSSEEIIEAGQNAKSAIEETVNTLKSQQSLINESGADFAKLAQGVDMLTGKNLTLDSDDYQRFLDLSNQLADAFPDLSRVYDENGNAIVQLGGNVDSITAKLKDLLEAQRNIANQDILAELPDAFNGSKEEATQATNDILNSGIISFRKTIQDGENDTYDGVPSWSIGFANLISGTISGSDKLAKILDDAKISYEKTATGIQLTEEGMQKFIENKDELLKLFEEAAPGIEISGDIISGDFNGEELSKLQRERSQNIRDGLMNGIQAAISTDFNYTSLSDGMQSIFQNVLNNIDYTTLIDRFKNSEDMINWITGDLLSVFQGESGTTISNLVNDTLEAQTKYESGDLGVQDWLNDVQALKDGVDGLVGVDQEVKDAINGMFDTTIETNRIDTLTNAFKGTEDEVTQFQKYINGLNSQELSVAYNLSVDEDTSNWNLEKWKDEVENNVQVEIAASLNIETEKTNIENLQNAIQESFSGSGLSDESITNVKSMFSDLDYDEADLFKKTANGIRLDSEELQKLNAEYENIKKLNMQEALATLVDKYNELGVSIENSTSASERSALQVDQDSVAAQIENISTLAAQYDGLTSSYNKWLQAQQAPDKGDMYDTIRDGLEGIKEAYDDGLVGTNEFREYVDLLSGEDLSTASVDEVVKAYENLDKTIKNTSYSALDFLDKDGEGIEHLLNALKEVGKANGQAWATVDDEGHWNLDFTNAEFGGLTGDDAVAKALGIDTEFLQAMLDKAGAYGFDVDLNSPIIDLENLTDAATQANEKLIELGKTDIKFDFEATGEELETQLSKAKEIYDEFTNKDGKINLELDGAEEAQTTLLALIKQKAELEDQPAIMDVEITDPTDATQNLISKLQDFQTKYSILKIMTELGVDTTGMQQEVDAARQEAQKAANQEGVKLKANLSFGNNESLANGIQRNLTPSVLVDAHLDLTEVNNTNVPSKDTTVTAHVIGQNQVDALKSTIDAISDKTVTVTYKQKTITPSANAGVLKNQANQAQGTAHARGTAFANGNWGTKDSGVALGGELGQELVS